MSSLARGDGDWFHFIDQSDSWSVFCVEEEVGLSELWVRTETNMVTLDCCQLLACELTACQSSSQTGEMREHLSSFQASDRRDSFLFQVSGCVDTQDSTSIKRIDKLRDGWFRWVGQSRTRTLNVVLLLITNTRSLCSQRTISVLQTELHWWCFLYYSIVFVSCAGNLWACSGRLCLPWEGLQRGAAADRQHFAVRPDRSRVRPGPVRHVPPQSERLSIITLSNTDELYPSKPQYQNMSVKILSRPGHGHLQCLSRRT